MFGNDTKYFGLVGEIITAEGEASSISEDAFVFSSSKRNKLVLLDYGHEASRRYLQERSERISGVLVPFIGKNLITPDKMISSLLNFTHTLMALKRDECDLDSVLMDTGSFLFSQNAGDHMRREDYTILDIPVMDYEGYDRITRIDTLLTTHTDNTHRDKRRKIVADAVSFLSGLVCQTLFSTRGRVAYAPMGSCTYVATAAAREEDRLVLVVNDPLGEGWRLVPEGTVDYSKAGELMEFSTKLIVDSLFGGKVKKNRRVNVLSSGAITMTGAGAIATVNTSEDKIEQVSLTEGRISIGYSSSNDAVTVNVGPTDFSHKHNPNKRMRSSTSSKNILSPSVFSWFNIQMNGITPESSSKDDSYEDSLLPFVRNKVYAEKKRKKMCRIADKGCWSDQLLRLDSFVRKVANNEAVDFMEEKMKNLSEVIGDSAGSNILASGELQCSSSSSSFTSATVAAAAAYALTDFNTEGSYDLEDGNEQRKSTLFPVLEYSKNVISLTVIGNAPTNGQTMRVVRLLKKMPGTTATATAITEKPSCPNRCKWYNSAPASMMTMGTSECHMNYDNYDNVDLVKMDPVFVYTPRCVYHSKTAYVHLYSDNEGPLYDIKFLEEDNILTIEGVNNNLLDINKPLAIGAVTTAVQKGINVANKANKDERMSAKPLKLFAYLDKVMDIVHFETKETEGEGGKEIMNDEVVKNVKWYQTVYGGSEDMPGPPDCLLKRVDDRGKVLNMALTQITKFESNVGGCVKREEVVNFIDTKYNKNKYPSPFDSALVKYGLVAADATHKTAREEERKGEERNVIKKAARSITVALVL